MKKLVMITVAALLLAKLSNAQTEKGDQTIGLTLGVNVYNSHQNTIDLYNGTNTANYYRQRSFGIAPAYSFFIAHDLDLGVSATYSNYILTNNYTPDQYASDQKQHQRDYSASLYLRKYFLYENKIGFRFGPYVSYDHEVIDIAYPETNSLSNSGTTTKAYSGGFQLDFVYYPTRHLSFTAALGNLSYQHSELSGVPTDGRDDNFNLAFISNNLSVGIFYNFN